MATLTNLDKYAKYDWMLKNGVIDIVVNNDGIVFGGAVRDKYLHDMHATMYYEHPSTQLHPFSKFTLYNNRDFLPEYFGRWVVPNDIDVFIHSMRLEMMIADLQKNFEIQMLFDRDPIEYLPNLRRTVKTNTMRHRRYRLHAIGRKFQGDVRRFFDATLSSCTMSILSEEFMALMRKITKVQQETAPIYMDVLISNVPLHESQPEPPFGDVDFLCNSLLYDRHGYFLSKNIMYGWFDKEGGRLTEIHRMRLKHKIFEQILRKEAVLHDVHVERYRYEKMQKKGWKIKHSYTHIDVLPVVNADPSTDASTDPSENASEPSEDASDHVTTNDIDAIDTMDTMDAIEMETCIICHDDFTDHDTQFKLNCCSARYHIKCLINACETGSVPMGESKSCIMCRRMVQNISQDIHVLRNIYATEIEKITAAETPSTTITTPTIPTIPTNITATEPPMFTPPMPPPPPMR